MTEEDVKQATQARGSLDDLPRIRPSIRRALNAALDRFSRRKDTVEDRSRSKSAGSTGPDSEATAGSVRGVKSSDSSAQYYDSAGSATPSAHSSPFLRGGGGGIGRWGSRASKKSESSGGGRDLDRSSSNQSFAVGSRFPHHLLPSSRKSSSRDVRGSEMSDYPSSREGSPLPPSIDSDMSASRRHLHKVFSVFGARAKPSRTNSTDSTVVLPKTSTEIDDRAVYASRRRAEPIPIPATTADEVDSTEFEYSSDEDQEESLEHESPLGQADNVLGWQSGFTHFADDIAAGFEEPVDQPRHFVPDETTPRSSAQHSSTDYAPSPTRKDFDAASKSSRGANDRDGSIREGGVNPKRWEVHSSDYDDEEEEGEDIFVAPRRRRAQPGS